MGSEKNKLFLIDVAPSVSFTEHFLAEWFREY